MRQLSVALQVVYICMLSSLLLFFSPEHKMTSWWGEGSRVVYLGEVKNKTTTTKTHSGAGGFILKGGLWLQVH